MGVKCGNMSGVQWTGLENGVIVRSKGEERIKLDSHVSNFVDLREKVYLI